MPLDPNIFLRGAALQQQAYQKMGQDIQTGVGLYTKGQQRQEEMRLKEAALAAKGLNLETLAPQIMLKKQQGIPLTEKEQAIAQTYDVFRGAERAYDPQTGGTYAKYDPIFGAIQGAQPTAIPPLPGQQIPQAAPSAIPQEVVAPVGELPVDLGDISRFGEKTPATRQAEQKEWATSNIKKKFADVERLQSEGRANEKVSIVLDRMDELNSMLKAADGIVSEDSTYAERLQAQISGTAPGQVIAKSATPEVQKLRDEYSKLQSTLLPFYAKAAGLGAKSLDSEGERKSILASFGDPTGIFESNKQQLENLRGLFGVNGAQRPVDGSNLQSLKDKYGL